MQNAADHSRNNFAGGAWLLADMTLNIGALTIVKALGLGYSASQIVFLRACIGLVILLPWAIRHRKTFAKVDQIPLHILRVVFSALALTASYFAISRLPFALFTTISFTRPVLTMIMAAIFLNEVVSRRRWIAAGIAFVGVLIAIQPNTLTLNWGLPAMGLAVFFGTTAIILTRLLSSTPTLHMMVFYTAGLALLTVPFAIDNWTAIPFAHLAPLLAIGVLAQCAQFCFLKAHGRADAGFLAILGYLSLVFTASVGYVFFKEVPSFSLILGAGLIVGTAILTSLGSSKS